MKTLTEKRFFHWVEDDIAVTLRNKSGSYGGGSEVLVIEDINTNIEGGVWTLDEKMGQTYIQYEQANTLAQRDYKQPQAVIYRIEEQDDTSEGNRCGLVQSNHHRGGIKNLEQ